MPTTSTDPQCQTLFTSGDGLADTYRIPALAVTIRGSVLAFCEARREGFHDQGQIDLVLRRSTDGGQTWGPIQVVATMPRMTCGNPCPVVDASNGTIWLAMTTNPAETTQRKICEGQADRTPWILRSIDDGVTWSAPVNLADQVKDPTWTWIATGPTHGIQLRTGRLVIPCNHQVSRRFDRTDPTTSHVIYSDNHGLTWHVGGSVPGMTNESTVVELDDGSVCLNCRVDGTAWEAAWPVGKGKAPRRRLVAWSWDGGRTFFDHRLDEALVDPHCQGSLLRVPSSPGRQGSCVLFSNLASESAREKLTIRVSFDGCRTWPLTRCLDPGPSAYSDLGMTPDGLILCLYETKAAPGETAATPYTGIRLARFDLEWFAAR